MSPARGLLGAAIALVLMSGALAGCGTIKGIWEAEKEPADYGDVAAAVRAAVPRIVEVDEPSRSTNGFGHRLSLGMESDSAEPFTVEELDALLEAIWTALPWEPNTVSVVVGADSPEGPVGVDLRTAAADLAPSSSGRRAREG